MSRPMIQAAVTMNQLQKKMDTIGNNLSNSQTTGYKSGQTEFASLLFQQIDNMSDPANADNRSTPDGIRIGTGARLADVQTDLAPGAIKETDRALDVALLKDQHLFQVAGDNDQIQYTRDGTFYLSEMDGSDALMLTTKNGQPVLGTNGPITLAPGFDDIAIASNGQVTVKRGTQTETAGTLAVVDVTRPNLLEKTGDNMFSLTESGDVDLDINDVFQDVVPAADLLKSGALEQSNVDFSKQMSDLTMTQRAYQFNARTISMSDQMSGLINQLR